jgi:hypothetical protein
VLVGAIVVKTLERRDGKIVDEIGAVRLVVLVTLGDFVDEIDFPVVRLFVLVLVTVERVVVGCGQDLSALSQQVFRTTFWFARQSTHLLPDTI